jgi:hypothetical protein
MDITDKMPINYTAIADAVYDAFTQTVSADMDEAVIAALKASFTKAIQESMEPELAKLTKEQPGVGGKGSKRPPTPYNLFTRFYQKEHKDEKELFKKVGQAWKSLSDAEKEPFIADANHLRDQAKKAEQPRRRPPNAYNLFMIEYRKAHPGEKELFRKAGEAWNQLTVQERSGYQEQSAKSRPERPKKKANMNGYNLFVKERMSQVRAANTDKSNHECMKIIANEWKTSNQEEWKVS